MGIPYAILFVTPVFILMLVQQLSRIFLSSVIYKFKIVDVSMSSDCSYAMIYFDKPKNYKLVHGQYVFFNVPEVNMFQWHPFTVASSPSSSYLILMVKKAGDWTNKLIQLLYERKKMMIYDDIYTEDHNEYDVFNLLHDLYQEIPLHEMSARNRLFFPKVKISRACATPNDTFIKRKNVVMIGAGSGISPYLPLLEEVISNDEGNPNKFNFESARLIFVAREGEQISWVSNFLFHVMSSKCVIPSLEFSVFITLDKDVKTLP